ncbi:hypothetical protein AVEN_229846-1 [Araneus ventricosus]|uniref:Uncharacterized protein n=1 Tax=Araneus ventricosus TaxID=182803 RepID=A0A4Y2PVE2_ARAVE|nr:hypothetical protein AVEN_229846-1 [Araneus ventricosus]
MFEQNQPNGKEMRSCSADDSGPFSSCLRRFSQHIIDMYGFGMEWEIYIRTSVPSPPHLRKQAPDLETIWWKNRFAYHFRTKSLLLMRFVGMKISPATALASDATFPTSVTTISKN